MRTGTKTAAMAVTVIAGTLVGGGLAGCQSDPQPVGSMSGSALTATYSMGTLSTVVARANIGPRDVAAAAEASFRKRGFTVRAAEVTADSCRIAGITPGGGNWQSTIVSASKDGGNTRIEVHVEPFGDEARSHEVMNDVLGRLGL